MIKLYGLIYLIPALLFPYGFGKNKVQYRDFHWRVLSTHHFDIFYYEGGEHLADFASSVLEEAFSEYEEKLRVYPDKIIPVIIYNCPREFKQTNVTLALIEEGIGGFTEIFKNRVVVPFTGSYEEFKHVLRHELVHVFQFNLFLKGYKPGLYLSPMAKVPLWLIEGTAEYYSSGWTEDAESYMRDITINGLVIPISKLAYYTGYIIYKEGQAFCRFVEEKYGERKVAELLHEVKLRKSFEDAVYNVLGLKMDDLDEEFENFLKKNFYPVLKDYDLVEPRQLISDHTEEGGFMYVAPAISPEGDKVVFISDKRGYTDVYLTALAERAKKKRIISGQKTPLLEYLHILRPGLSFSPDGEKIVLTSEAGKDDYILIYSLRKRKFIKKIPSGLDAALTPAWSPDGSKIAFTGLKNGKSDIYVYDLEMDTLGRITDDYYDDRSPSFSSDGKKIYFASDRNDGDLFGSYAIYSYSLETGEIERITPHLGELDQPVERDSLVLFTFRHEGSKNIFAYNLKDGKFYKVTNFISEVKGFSISSRKSRLVVSVLRKGGYDIAYVEDWEEHLVPVELKETPGEELGEEKYVLEDRPFRREFTLDWIAGSMAISIPFGLYGDMTLGISDQMGDHRIMFTSDLYTNITNSNFEFIYLNLEERTDYGFNFYQYWDFYPFSDYFVVVERRLGLSGVALYPFSKFTRVEGGLGYERLTWYSFLYNYYTDEWEEVDEAVYDILSVYAAYVVDKTLYTLSGPIDGYRYFTGFEKSFLSDLDFWIGYADIRKYFRLTRRSTFALRFIGGHSGGKDPLPFWLGGATTLRGYDDYEFQGQNVVLLNTELRVPFVDRLKIAFPLPIEFNNVKGVLFFDMGNAWNEEKFQPFEKGGHLFKLKDLHGSVGVGIRIGLGLINLKIDAARQTDLYNISSKTKYHISLGWDY